MQIIHSARHSLSALRSVAEAGAAIDPARAERIATSLTDDYVKALALSRVAKALASIPL